MSMGETYNAQGECSNCGYENWPQWGEYKLGTKITDYACPKCGCMTWGPRNRTTTYDPDLGKTSDSITKE